MELDMLINEYNESLESLATNILSFKISHEDISVITLQEMMIELGTTLDGKRQTKKIKSNLRNVYEQYTLELENKIRNN